MSDQISMAQRYQPHDAAVENQSGTLTVLMHLNSGVVFRLDPVGAHIWALICEGGTCGEEICAVFRREYSGIGDELEDDIRAFLSQLSRRNLIVED